MILKILLVISIVLQIFAAVKALGLIRRTKYNVSWMLFTVAFCAMTVVRFGEYMQTMSDKELHLPPDFFVWLGVVTSLCVAVGVLYTNKLFNYIDKLELRRRLTERRILNTVLHTEEKERMRFSKELHDGLGPLLSSAKMSLSALSAAEQTEANRKIMENTAYVIDEAIHSLREISNKLSPHILNDFGLAKGISNFVSKSGGGRFKMDFKTNLGGERFDTDIEVILYRVICELVGNSIRHSAGDRIDISLQKEGDTLVLNYSDNGRGFNPPAVMDTGMGLSNITSRINSLKGDCVIESSHGNGMKAFIRVGLKSSDKEK